MLNRWYAIFIGIILLVMGIVGFLAPNFLTGDLLGFWVPFIWLITGVAALIVGLAVKNIKTVRVFNGVVGGLYLLWGLIGMFAETFAITTNPLGFIVFLIGALGVASALAPIYWVQDHTTYAPEAT
ncbi:MAG: hypothetical protein ACYDCO_23055 [Armatimonadota bacterium]